MLHVSRSTRTSHAVFVVPVVLESADETADELQLRLANRWTAESPPFSGRALAGRLGMPRMVPANALDADCIPRGGWQQLHGVCCSQALVALAAAAADQSSALRHVEQLEF